MGSLKRLSTEFLNLCAKHVGIVRKSSHEISSCSKARPACKVLGLSVMTQPGKELWHEEREEQERRKEWLKAGFVQDSRVRGLAQEARSLASPCRLRQWVDYLDMELVSSWPQLPPAWEKLSPPETKETSGNFL